MQHRNSSISKDNADRRRTISRDKTLARYSTMAQRPVSTRNISNEPLKSSIMASEQQHQSAVDLVSQVIYTLRPNYTHILIGIISVLLYVSLLLGILFKNTYVSVLYLLLFLLSFVFPNSIVILCKSFFFFFLFLSY